MKTAEIKDLLKKEILIIENSEQTILTTTATGCMLRDNSTNGDFFIEGYTLLGKPDEIREDDAQELVESGDADPVGDRFILSYKSYFDGYEDDIPQFTCETATESLLSAIETVVLWENPYAEPDKFIDGFDNPCYEWWQDAELRTFDRSRTIILKKNKQ